MKVVILCGGLGTRLREETEARPKPMVPIGDRPILWHIMKYYASFGHTEFILCLGYKGEVIKDYFRNYHWNTSDVTIRLGPRSEAKFHTSHGEENWVVTLANTGDAALTGDRVRSISGYVQGESDFLLTYGDGVSTIDLDRSIAFHKESGAICTLTGVHPPGRFGELDFDEDGRVREFHEKPQTHSDYINGGFMVCRSDFFDFLPNTPGLDLERSVINELIKHDALAVYRHDGFWQPMDTYREYRYLNEVWNQGVAPWKRWED